MFSIDTDAHAPISSARFSSRVGGSRRSGRELISTAVPCSRQAVNTACREHGTAVEINSRPERRDPGLEMPHLPD
ncbi:hypothetical protein MAHJHV55_52800 [Mycobacterium avium subsp. hominissuis]